MYYYTNEIVFRGHPDKVCDQISDALLDAYLNGDSNSRCGIEVAGGKGKIFITGEVTSSAKVNVEEVAKRVLADIGYTTDFEIINNIGIQSPDIAMGVDTGGAGDQGMMFGYACNETGRYIPKAMAILQALAWYYDTEIRVRDGFLPDGKAQITGIYDDNGKLHSIKTFLVSYQNDGKDTSEKDEIIKQYVKKCCLAYRVPVDEILINPTGKFTIGGFDGDAGLTGRKIVVDNYHSFAPVGGGAFSGKDPTKVDRSAAYMARYLAMLIVKDGVQKGITWCKVQLSYAIGVARPMSIYAETNLGKFEVEEKYYEICKPQNIIEKLKLKPNKDGMSFSYEDTAKYGHFGWIGVFPWECICDE